MNLPLTDPDPLARDYPVRRVARGGRRVARHSRRYSDATLRRTLRQYHRHLAVGDNRAISRANDLFSANDARSGFPGPRATGRAFAEVARAWQVEHGRLPGALHAASAFALVHRRVEAVPALEDRWIVCAMAASVLARCGSQVHLVTGSDIGTEQAYRRLVPVMARLGSVLGRVMSNHGESERHRQWRQRIVICSAREVAMDFLRDAVAWPRRADPVARSVDRMLGPRARSPALLMRGLPCAIHVDADDTLIDNARNPMVLTRDAHPMHETEELQKALEMARLVEVGTHFQWLDGAEELRLTEAGNAQLSAWSEALSGLWNTPHIATLLLQAAIVSSHLVRPGRHYQVVEGRIHWLVREALVPGAPHYGLPFIQRLVELREDCAEKRARESIGRISYQQLFNRYRHLCGVSHSVSHVEPELRQVYGLRSFNRWPTVRRPRWSRAGIAADRDRYHQRLRSWAESHDADSARMVVFFSRERLEAALAVIREVVPGARVIESAEAWRREGGARAGDFCLLNAPVAGWFPPVDDDETGCPLRILVAERSTRIAEDRRCLHPLSSVSSGPPSLLLCREDELFTGGMSMLSRVVWRVFGLQFPTRLAERLVSRQQRRKAREMSALRKNLMSHDSGMEGLLSFSGKGLYD